MNTLTIRTENPNLLSLVKDFLKKYKEIEIIEDEISEDKLKIYLELDTQKKQRNL